ncbi:hypothetical protein Ocin01_14357, partial [Orchesella cincta]
MPMGVPCLLKRCAGQDAASSHLKGSALVAGTSLLGRQGVSMNFSGPVHVHVDNMYMYDESNFAFNSSSSIGKWTDCPTRQPAIQLRSQPRLHESGILRKKGVVSDPAQVSTTGNDNENDGDSPGHPPT